MLKGNSYNTNNHLKINNVILTTDEAKEEAHCKIWRNIFRISPEENPQYDPETERIVDEYLNNNNDKITIYQTTDISTLLENQPLIKPINIHEIKYTIKSFKTNTPGETKINKTILLNLEDNCINILKNLFNQALSMGYFPQYFKTGIIKLIPKPNTDHTSPINYRPISLLGVTGNFFEKIFNPRLIQYLENNNLLPNTQYGFTKGRSTDTAIAVAHETIAHHTANND